MRIVYSGSGRLTFRAKLLIGVLLGMSVALVTVMALVAIGVLLFLLPVAVIGAAIYAFLPKRRTAPPRSDGPDVLEGQYRVVHSDERDRLPRQ